ncbi:hypothetical protein RB25_15155 [Herbaspirillum rubrisubalbicans]|uniref:Lipoprotein n=2 Tax=Herbaspirillum rubrisubalbicans TaxID=80842 RepID=A0ABX9BZ26_9BURK|nr:hypothetical protein [Herbaspirillum rubrisubalbicans]MCP1575284.1 hypothetical protein [Herbaspirillum rubrisubalbicans]NQE50754.1 hypothetical protein [Herbaspirillum rubrisubalbicans]QJQ03765.1 hypothetical protein C798_27035 [Herbaspirillum rubrisubalbicans Os34]RAM63017.1 hypothetical protein RB24_18840 [Herbaspirillum rubrisubalbicans]RAN46789.1 hypothetical protein RB25_15155 [Herbaspirillum rubrisubalbicans]
MRNEHHRHRRRAGSLVVACLGAAALGGCANFSEVSAEHDDLYMVSATGVSYTMSIAALTSAARDKASAFCGKQQMQADLRQLIRGWRPMQVELYFRCKPVGLSLQALL